MPEKAMQRAIPIKGTNLALLSKNIWVWLLLNPLKHEFQQSSAPCPILCYSAPVSQLPIFKSQINKNVCCVPRNTAQPCPNNACECVFVSTNSSDLAFIILSLVIGKILNQPRFSSFKMRFFAFIFGFHVVFSRRALIETIFFYLCSQDYEMNK